MKRADAVALDDADPLAFVRERFVIPDGLIYLDGNSLGMLPLGVAERVGELIRAEWGVDLIRSWNKHQWMQAPRRVGDRIGALVGAHPGEVIAADSTSVNLYKALVGAIRMRPGRSVIVTEAGNFPSDRYLIDAVADQFGCTVRLADPTDLIAAFDEDVAVVSLSHADYRSGVLYDMSSVTAAAHAVGALVAWDLAHTAGVVDLALAADGVDFAVGCGYKFLNGGPGAPGFLYVAQRHQAVFRQPIEGWLGHAEPFAMTESYKPAADISRAIVGTPNMLSLVALEAALDAFDGVDLAIARTKSVALTELMLALADQWCPGLAIATPRDQAIRGSHVSFRHPFGFQIVQALIASGIVGDFREPDILRFGVSALYTRFVDVWDFVSVLREVLIEETWRDPAFAIRGAVT